MLFNCYDSSPLCPGCENCELQPDSSTSYSGQMSPVESAFHVSGNNANLYPMENHGLLQSQYGARHFQNMLHDACNKDEYWRSQEPNQTTSEGYHVSSTYNARLRHLHHHSLSFNHIQWNRNAAGYDNSTGNNVDLLYSPNPYQSIQPPQSRDKSEVGDEMTILSSHGNSGQGIVALDNQTPLQLPVFNQVSYRSLIGSVGIQCNEANPLSFPERSSSSSSLVRQPPVLDNTVRTTCRSGHLPKTESTFVSRSYWKPNGSKLDKKKLSSSNEDSITSQFSDIHQRKSSKSAGKTRTKDKYRTVYSESQRVELERQYSSATYITSERKSAIARCVGLTDRQVKIWFQNRRAKERKDRRKTESSHNMQHQ